MKLAITIYYISTIAWIFPMFRQYRCNLFYFFLFLGICDPLSILAAKSIHLKVELITAIIAPILFYTINIDRQKNFTINKLEIFVFILTYTLLFLINNYNVIILIIHTLVTIRVIFKIIIELHHYQKINLFHFVLAFYMITSVASLIIYLNSSYQGMVLFYINLAFQILLAIFFATFRENNPKLTYSVIPALKD